MARDPQFLRMRRRHGGWRRVAWAALAEIFARMARRSLRVAKLPQRLRLSEKGKPRGTALTTSSGGPDRAERPPSGGLGEGRGDPGGENAGEGGGWLMVRTQLDAHDLFAACASRVPPLPGVLSVRANCFCSPDIVSGRAMVTLLTAAPMNGKPLRQAHVSATACRTQRHCNEWRCFAPARWADRAQGTQDGKDGGIAREPDGATFGTAPPTPPAWSHGRRAGARSQMFAMSAAARPPGTGEGGANAAAPAAPRHEGCKFVAQTISHIGAVIGWPVLAYHKGGFSVFGRSLSQST